MREKLTRIIGITSILAPGLHLLSDILEWINDGFTSAQLLINYVAFLAIPFLIVGLCYVQRETLHWYGLVGSVIYGVSFIYFAHSTLVAFENSVPTYDRLWTQLGPMYTLHGAFMVVGGLLFGLGSLRARIISRAGTTIFLSGIGLNLLLSLSTLSAGYQIIGSGVRNLGLMLIGVALVNEPGRTEPNARS